MPADEHYRTVTTAGTAKIANRGSRFIGTITGVESVEMAEDWIEKWYDTHPEATHIVPAYRIRSTPFREWSSDAGEPHGSAGKPILSVLQGEELEDVVAVVIRYYGGTNLGIGGLVRSYSTVIREAIDNATVETRVPHVTGTIETPYDDSGTVRSILESADVLTDATYDETVTFCIDVPTDSVETIDDRVLSATGGRIHVKWRE